MQYDHSRAALVFAIPAPCFSFSTCVRSLTVYTVGRMARFIVPGVVVACRHLQHRSLQRGQGREHVVAPPILVMHACQHVLDEQAAPLPVVVLVDELLRRRPWLAMKSTETTANLDDRRGRKAAVFHSRRAIHPWGPSRGRAARRMVVSPAPAWRPSEPLAPINSVSPERPLHTASAWVVMEAAGELAKIN
jgi:hypothetical protein